MKKKVKVCSEFSHDWYKVGKCKDALGKHPCKYFPEGCETCMTKFECYTKDRDTYRTRITAIFYACKKCPAIKAEGTISSWETEEIKSVSDSGLRRGYAQLDIRESGFIGMDEDTATKLRNRWKDE